MSAPFLTVIDWHRPWLLPFQETAKPILVAADWRDELNAQAKYRSLCNHRGLPLRFVPQADLPPGMAYEAFISSTGCVPTRDNLHDFFNALVWLSFPRIKVQLNALQAAEIAKAAGSLGDTQSQPVVMRGKLRDAATIFDENAALLMCADASLLAALRDHQWKDIFLTRRSDFMTQCELRLFGHALMEKLVTPYKAITAHAWPVVVDESFFSMTEAERRSWVDGTIAARLADGLTTAAFTPLPVLGVPSWWPSQNQAYYADTTVFRPQRIHR